ncbi:MAG: cytochrome c [Candidimonas sp.]|nr:MAG: cytochrome c [Candidimonas sp.]
MSDNSEQTRAQRREMPEPYESNFPAPWYVIVFVAGLFIWAVGYIGMAYRDAPSSLGDHRVAADFVVAKAAPGAAIDGGQIYTSHCLACHQATGQGLPGVFPPLAGSEWVDGKASTTIQIVLHGVEGALTVKGTTYRGQMPTFKDQLDDGQIAAVVSHIRASFGNSAGAVTADEVKAERERTKDHTAPWNGDAELNPFK